VKVFGFHTMPYPDVTADDVDRVGSSWVTLPNALFDPARGHELYQRYLRDLVAYDRAGFDGVCVNEHHQTIFGLMPSPNVVAALLIPLVKGKIAILGNALPLRDDPVRVAEEVAMLDVISGGRIISGFVRGLGSEYVSYGIDPTESFTRFEEAHDLIVKAWTEPGPFEWYGKHYKLRYVNPWPRPLQKPHPPIWTPGSGSAELIDWAAKHRYGYSLSFRRVSDIARLFADFREVAATKYGYDAPPELTAWSVVIHVADTDEEARRQAKPHVEWLFSVATRIPAPIFAPPGHQTLQSALRRLSSGASAPFGQATFETMNDQAIVIAGSPETVRQRLQECYDQMQFGTLLGTFEIGGLDHEAFAKSVALFGEKIWPHLQPLGASTDVHAGTTSGGNPGG
jgi:alkanesulfonate monooxygenase SsuD/methylene tetrahydromethanopterin reductase-like flavin-dependent oxidoreductase (luciferase family)